MGEKKKALLIVAGGRALPDVLALFHVQPEGVVFLTSEEGWSGEDAFMNVAKSFPSCRENIHSIRGVNAYDFEAGKKACIKACERFPENEWDWTFTIGTAPKVTAIAAYEVAKQKNIPCLYIDTLHEKIVSFVKDPDIAAKNIFHMNVPEYMNTQQREPEVHKEEKLQYRRIAEDWGYIAKVLALSPVTPSFIKIMRDKKRNKVPIKSVYIPTSPLVQELESLGVIKIEYNGDGETTCAFTSNHYGQFVGTGDWLEVYVWNEVNEARFADDCQWGYHIISTADNELDVVLTYNAQLIFAECKTEGEPFQGKTSHLDTISTKAAMLGGTYVTKLFITNEPKTQSGYSNFIEQAKLRKIVVVTQEDLPNIGQILKREALTPTYSRI